MKKTEIIKIYNSGRKAVSEEIEAGKFPQPSKAVLDYPAFPKTDFYQLGRFDQLAEVALGRQPNRGTCHPLEQFLNSI